jgi:hypothetical protein
MRTSLAPSLPWDLADVLGIRRPSEKNGTSLSDCWRQLCLPHNGSDTERGGRIPNSRKESLGRRVKR